MTRCIIVGDGPSARGFIPPDGVPVIAVKRTIQWITRADYWFSLDPNDASLAAMRNPRQGVAYFCACDDAVTLPPGVTRLRRIASRGREPRPRNTPAWWAWRWSAVPRLCAEPDAVHSGNSAWGALGLAYHLGFRDILLVGIDGTADQRISGGRPGNLAHLPRLFASALSQVRLRTVGKMSGIPRITLEEWVNESPRN